jgi:Phage terminase, small subunit
MELTMLLIDADLSETRGYGLGEPPPDLPEASRVVWAELAPELEQAGVATVLDRAAFELLCEALGEYRRRRAQVEHLAYATSAAKRAVKLMCEFGMTPARARTRVEVVDRSIANDPTERWFRRSKASKY